MKRKALGFLIVLVIQLSNIIGGAIPPKERAALIALYNSTNGDNWTKNSGWKTPPLHTDGFAMPGTEESWYGVGLSGDRVKYLSLYKNQLSGRIPAELSYLSNLVYLDLSDNQLSGSIPAEVCRLSNLQELSLGKNQLSGRIPYDLGELSHLYSLSLEYNRLSGRIPGELGNLSSLGWLWLNNNQLSGRIPASFGNLTNLRYLYLDQNQLSDIIPPELGNLSKLIWLWLNDNQLSGSIPAELGNLSNLEKLTLSHNQLSGNIPPELGNISYLWKLALNNNQLSGDIPPELGNLSGLWALHLNNNQLSGAIPSSFTNLTRVNDLDIGYNCLSVTDSTLRSWLDSHDPDWENTQCLEKTPPFGSFETPIRNTTVSGSIPITGWALDDYGMDSVKIYYVQEQSLVFIGDAIFVKGARPDVEAAYPGYPGNDRAGWGYMMLTNGLPNGGNGTYVLHAIATDIYGKTTTLGTRTIIVDNVHAVKPFGAIDTPAQGGIAFGNRFYNMGWVLTPLSNQIPIGGSTINVWVDGIAIGHPYYGIYREDIAALFPGYANSNNAGARFTLDTTPYIDGLHTISWTATDDAGNQDGIGCRFFEIFNTGQSVAASGPMEVQARIPRIPQEELPRIPLDYTGPILFKKGFARESTPQTVYPGDNGITSIAIKELERVVIHLDEPADLAEFSHLTLNTKHLTLKNSPSTHYYGYLANGSELKPLPIGSTLDAVRGVFYWQPGPGFIGTYSLIFFNRTGDWQKKIKITILPRN